MNLFLKQLIILIIGNLLISTVSCDETIELTCTTDDDCKSFENKFIFSECADDACVCQNRKDETWVDCSPSVSSVSNEDVKGPICKAPNTEFRLGSCRTKVVSIGKACEETLQCERNDWNSICVDKACTCKEHFMAIDNACRSIVETDKCTKDEQCPENAACVQNKCVCNKEFIGSSDYAKCLPFRAYDEPCEESSQCLMRYGFGSQCTKKGVCQCKNNYSPIQKDGASFVSCIRNAYVGDTCFSDEECFSNSLQMYCVDYMCSCKRETDKTTTISSCKKKAQHASPLTSGAASIKVFNLFSVIVLFSVLFAL